MTTKADERKALDRIRAIIDEMGEDSYIATAFAGCLQDAADNIEHDMAMSWKDRAETANKLLDSARKTIADRDARIDSLVDSGKEAKAAYDALKYEAATEAAALKKKILPADTLLDLWLLLTDDAEKARRDMAAAAETMAQLADHPTDIAFTTAVKIYRQSKERAETCEQLADGVDAVITR